MNKLVLCLTAVCLIVTKSANAQLSYGGRAGMNMSNISGDFGSGTAPSMGIGFHVGGIVNYALSDAFSIQPEVLFSTKGWSQVTTMTIMTINVKSDTKASYSFIEIPINAKYTLPMGLNFYGGPYLGMLMGANYHSVTSVTGQPDKTTDVSDTKGLRSMDFGINAGVGYQLEMGLGFNAGYELGLADINDPSGTNKYTHTVISISVSYLMGGK